MKGRLEQIKEIARDMVEQYGDPKGLLSRSTDST